MLLAVKQIFVQQPNMVCVVELGNSASSVVDLIGKVFPNYQENVVDSDWLLERGILAPLNESVSKINSKLIYMMPASSKLYKSTDTDKLISDGEATHYPPEFLNSIETSGLPPHKLNIKIGMPVMVLRFLNPPRLMNDTRRIVTKPLRNFIEVKIADRPLKNETHLIPRVHLQESDSILPFTFQGQHFPMRPCFGLTIDVVYSDALD